jgi:hypothetical protein
VNKSVLLFTGLHHAREPLSVSMNIFIITKLLFEVQHAVKSTLSLLDNVIFEYLYNIKIKNYYRNLYVFINIDSFLLLISIVIKEFMKFIKLLTNSNILGKIGEKLVPSAKSIILHKKAIFNKLLNNFT